MIIGIALRKALHSRLNCSFWLIKVSTMEHQNKLFSHALPAAFGARWIHSRVSRNDLVKNFRYRKYLRNFCWWCSTFFLRCFFVCFALLSRDKSWAGPRRRFGRIMMIEMVNEIALFWSWCWALASFVLAQLEYVMTTLFQNDFSWSFRKLVQNHLSYLFWRISNLIINKKINY